MHIVELAEQYIEEVKAKDTVPKQSRRLSIIDRFTNILFPDMRGKGKGKGKNKKGQVRKKRKQLSQEERKQVVEQRKKHRKAVRKVEYWKQLGIVLLGIV
jgi:ATP-dependent protease HslVU (ClpYQ) ATPase subunit